MTSSHATTAFALGALCTVSAAGVLIKFGGPITVALYAITAVAVAFMLIDAGRLLPRWIASRAAWWLILIGGIAVAAFVWLYPLAQSGVLGDGSDRDEALDQAIAAILQNRPPYAEPTYLGNPITPLPGAFLLGLPFHLLGGAAWQNPAWLLLFLVAIWRVLPGWPAIAAAALLVVGHPGFLRDFVTGGDYAISTLLVTLAGGLSIIAIRRGAAAPVLISTGLILGICLCTKLHFLLLLLPIALFAIRSGAAKPGLTCCATALLVWLGLTVPVYLVDPSGFTPLALAANAEAIPYGSLLLPLGGLVASAACYPLLTEPRRLLPVAAAMMAVITLPPVAAILMIDPTAGQADLEYLYPVTLWAGLWLILRRDRKVS